MSVLAAGVRYLNLGFQGIQRVIATGVLETPDGVALVDPGPSSCLPALRDGLERLGVPMADVTSLFLTHIHLDHAGASGTLVRDHPRLKVFVHQRGAAHMENPSKLLESARRLYGEMMDPLWGEFLAVPADNLVTLAGGEHLDLGGGRRLEVAYTPGHASHHVSFYDKRTGIAWVGDSCGGRVGPSTFVMPTTPPPDVDLEAWSHSLDRILAWEPATLFLTHFGPFENPRVHIEELRARFDWASRLVRDVLARHPAPGEDLVGAAIFRREVIVELRRHVSAEEVRAYELAVPIDMCYLGLARYWRKRGSQLS